MNWESKIYKAMCECHHTNEKRIIIKEYCVDNEIFRYENQFVVLIKPECFNGGIIDTPQILGEMMRKFAEYGVVIHSAAVINGDYVRKHRIAENQYYNLNYASNYGFEKLPIDYQKKLMSYFPNHIILGAYQFLQMFPKYTVEELEKKSHKKGAIKIGNGNYAFVLHEDGSNYVVLNAFHPHQVKHFQKFDSVMVALECLSNKDYSILVDNLIGYFNPKLAKQGSLRNYLYKNVKQLHLDEIGIFYNGFHISPSPLEAMWAINRYCVSDNKAMDYSDYSLGKRLLSSGMKKIMLDNFKKDFLCLYKGKIVSLYELCEGKNTSDIIEVIKEINENLVN